MGCGKTYIGKQLAKILDFNFFDIDDEVEAISGKSITTIFREEGESVFRDYETRALLSLSKKPNAVIATGGGTPCFLDNMKIIKESGISVYLKISPKRLAQRLEKNQESRPLIQSNNNSQLIQKITGILKNREKYYMKADYIINEKNGNANYIKDMLF